MNKRLQQKFKSLPFIILIIIGLLLLSNTNNNPNVIIQRIFLPIHIGSGRIYYATIIPILLIYYSFKGLYKQNNYTLLNTRTKRIIILVLILSILPSCTQDGLKVYKSFYNDLNSIYCYRNNMNLSVETKENKQRVFCNLELQNCSSKKKEFYVKVSIPRYFDEIKVPAIANADTAIILNPHERRNFEITLAESDVNSIKFTSVTSGSIKNFEFSLYNVIQEVKFTQSDDAL